MGIGIEKINFYSGSLVLDLKKLASVRNKNLDYFKKDLMIEQRSYNVDYEDVITMAVNSALPILKESDKKDIGLCIFATESGLDYCKSNSTYLCKYLGLNEDVRNFEIKHACYATTSALQMAIFWLMSGIPGNKKALIVSSDVNYFDKEKRSGEEMPSVGAVAMLISKVPEIVEFEIGKNGLHSFECLDYARPTQDYDVINSQESLFAYLECLEESWARYKEKLDLKTDLKTYFRRIIYHAPFGGLVKLAHKYIQNDIYCKLSKKDIEKTFFEKVYPSLKFSIRVGNTYSSSVYACLISLIDEENFKEGDRVGIFSYGSGSSSEFYSVLMLENAKKRIKSLNLDKILNSRYELNIDEFKKISSLASSQIANPNFSTNLNFPKGWYEQKYKGKNLLILRSVKDYVRNYEWS